MLFSIPFYLFDKSSEKNPAFKKDRIVNAVTMIGLSYGFSRIARYNLIQSHGDAIGKRFNRNLLETHAAYIIPVFTGVVLQNILTKKLKSGKVQTTLQFTGTGLCLAMRF